MVVGTLVVDVLLGDVHSLKQKRGVVRPILAELRRRFDVAAAETGSLDLHRRAELAVAVVSSARAHARDVLDACERLVADRPEIELLSARQRVLDDDDLDNDMENADLDSDSDSDSDNDDGLANSP
jgi:uncharacterized protein